MYLMIVTSDAGSSSNITIPALLRKMEDPRTRLTELLVAPDVSVHWTLHQDVRPLLPDQDPTPKADRRTPSDGNSGSTMGHDQRRLHCGASGSTWVRRDHGSSGFP